MNFADDDLQAIRNAFGEDDDTTPGTPGDLKRRGCLQRGGLCLAVNAGGGVFEASDEPTRDPPDFARIRIQDDTAQSRRVKSV